MSNDSKQRRVRYVVGDCFGQPVVCEHIVPADDKVEDTTPPVSTTVALSSAGAGANKTRHPSKRTCGQSQQSARLARKQRIANKK